MLSLTDSIVVISTGATRTARLCNWLEIFEYVAEKFNDFYNMQTLISACCFKTFSAFFLFFAKVLQWK
jgi:hypothetical protein